MEKVINLKAKLLNEEILSQKLDLRDVCYGICSETYLREIVKDKQFPDKLLMDSLMQRVSLDTEKYESIVSREEYEIIKRIDRAILAIDEKRIDNAFDEIKAYEKMISGKNVVYYQLRAILVAVCRMESEAKDSSRLAYETLLKAIKMTISNYTGVESILNRCISRTELILHIFIVGLENENNPKESTQVDINKVSNEIKLFYQQKKSVNNKEIGKILAHYSEYIGKLALNHGMVKEAYDVVEDTLKMLGDIKRIYNILNLLKLKNEILKTNTEWAEKKSNEKNMVQWVIKHVEELYGEFDIKKESYSWCIPYGTNEIYAIDYSVQTRRAAMNISQEELAADICTARTIYNIEAGKYEPKPKVRIQILRRLGINYCDYGMLESFDIEHHKLAAQCPKLINDRKYTEFSIILEKLKKELPDTRINRQFVQFKTVLLENIRTGKRDITILPGLINALEQTCHVWNGEAPWVYTEAEINIAYNIADLIFRKKNIKKAKGILKKIMSFYEEQELELRHFMSGYSMVQFLLGSWLGSLGMTEEALAVSKRNMRQELIHGGSFAMVKKLYDISWDMDNIQGSPEEKKSIDYMKYAYALGILIDESTIPYIKQKLIEKNCASSLPEGY